MDCKIKSDLCKERINDVNHEGTELKFDAFAEYTVVWLKKVIHNNEKPTTKYKVNRFSFVDCMCSSGLYHNEETDSFVDGTAIRVMKIFKKIADDYPKYDFYLYFNDYDEQYYNCLECLNRDIMEDKPSNLYIKITKLDKNEFIHNLTLNYEFKRNDNQSLIIYDPYDVDFNWDYLSGILKVNADFLFTHFFPNDTKRAITVVKNKDKIEKLEGSYQTSFNDLKAKFIESKVPAYRSKIFRDMFTNLIHEYSNKKYSCYCPVFAKQNHVYDIVCLSHSRHAIGLLKDEMYKLYKKQRSDVVKNVAAKQLSFDIFGQESEEIRSADISEFKFHYNDGEILEKFKSKFKGLKVTKAEMDKMLAEDPYLPTQGFLKDVVKPKWPYETPSQTGGFYKFKDGD